VAELEVSHPSSSATALRERVGSGDLDSVNLRQLLVHANRLFAGRFDLARE
jgi:hypothetical protein